MFIHRPSPMLLRQKGTALPPAPSVTSVYAASLWTGNVTARTITNSVNMSGKGALAWIKNRSQNLTHHFWMDTIRGAGVGFSPTNGSGESTSTSNFLSAFGTSGFSMNPGLVTNTNSQTFVGWAFAQNQRFFKMISYTGDDSPTTLTHNLGVEPGLIFIFARGADSPPVAWFRGMTDLQYFDIVEGGSIQNEGADAEIVSSVDEVSFYTHSQSYTVGNGVDYMAYVFAHDENADGICRAGSYTGNGSATGPTVTLGWQPRFLMIKRNGGSPLIMFDAVRGLTTSTTANDPAILFDTSAEVATSNFVTVTSTGFFPKNDSTVNASGNTYYYWAIRN